VITDDKVQELISGIASQRTKPDKRRRWTVQVVERMLVAERAATIIICAELLSEPCERWHDAQQQAITELRKEGRIRCSSPSPFPDSGNQGGRRER
jgi:hypothetical protein